MRASDVTRTPLPPLSPPLRMTARAAAAPRQPLRAYLTYLTGRKPTTTAFSDPSTQRSVDFNLVFSKRSLPRQTASRCQAIYEAKPVSTAVWAAKNDDYDDVKEEDDAEEEDAAASYPKRLPRVIYEDEDLIAVDKPVGVSFQPSGVCPGILATLRALQNFNQLPGSEYTGPLHVVHTLDEMTSGVGSLSVDYT